MGTWLMAGAMLGFLSFFYLAQIQATIRLWTSNHNGSHEHVLILLAVAVFFLFQSRHTIVSLKRINNYQGVCIIGLALLLYALSYVLVINSMIYLSFVMCVGGVIIHFFGKPGYLLFQRPLLLVALTTPFPLFMINTATLPLKSIVSIGASKCLYLLQVPVYLEGVILQLPNMQLEVVNACSGIRSAFALFLLCLFLSKKERVIWVKGAIMLSIVPIVTFANILRVTMNGVVAYYYGAGHILDICHTVTGYGALILEISLLFWGVNGLQKMASRARE